MDNEKIESESQSGRGGGSQIVANLDSSGIRAFLIMTLHRQLKRH